jgi:hypothetical protein
MLQVHLPHWVRYARDFRRSGNGASRPAIRRLVAEAQGDVVTIGPLSEIFGPASRAVLKVERAEN